MTIMNINAADRKMLKENLEKMNLIQAQRNELMKVNIGVPDKYINMDLIHKKIE